MSVKEDMLKAKALIQAKRYDEAREVLRQIDHPTAREWLAKLDARAPQTKDKQRTASAQRSSGSRLPVLLGGGLLIVLIAVGTLLLLPRLNPTAATSTPAPTIEQIGANSPTAVPSEAPPAQEDTPAPGGQTVSAESSGLRVPFAITYGLVTVDLPVNWTCDCAGARGALRPDDDARSVVNTRLMDRAFNVQYYADKPLSEALTNDLSEDESIVAQETLQAGQREVLFASVTDEDGDEEKRYYVKDSSGFVIRMTIPFYVDAPEALRDAVLLMLGSAEATSGPESLELSKQLVSAGISFNSALNRWRIADTLDAGKEHYLELPPGWTVGRGLIGFPVLELEDGTPSATAVVSVPGAFFSSSDPLEAVLAQFVQGDEQRGAETFQVGERAVVYGLYFDNSAETAYYLTRDSDGDIIGFIVQPDVTEKAALQDSLLFIAGTIETEPVDYLALLRRVGIIAGGTDDGYVIVTPK